MSDQAEYIVAPTSGVGERLALLLTLIINPLVLPPLVVFLTLHGVGANDGSFLSAIVATIICFSIIPFAAMVGVALRHRNVSIELRDRRYRTVPFLVSIAANVGAVMYFNMWRSDAQGLILVLMVVYLLNNVVLMAINFKFKISLHMASIAGTASILLFMVAGVRPIPIIESTWLVLVAMTFILLVPVLWWARRKLDAHTSRELIAGALFGLIIPFIELYLLSPAFA